MPLRLGSSPITLRLGTQAVTAYLGTQPVSATVPGAPTISNFGQELFVQGDELVVYVNAPSGNGGSPILGYYFYVDGVRLPTQSFDLQGPGDLLEAVAATITETVSGAGQLAGAEVTVSAYNAIGEGPQSAAIVPQ